MPLEGSELRNIMIDVFMRTLAPPLRIGYRGARIEVEWQLHDCSNARSFKEKRKILLEEYWVAYQISERSKSQLCHSVELAL